MGRDVIPASLVESIEEKKVISTDATSTNDGGDSGDNAGDKTGEDAGDKSTNVTDTTENPGEKSDDNKDMSGDEEDKSKIESDKYNEGGDNGEKAGDIDLKKEAEAITEGATDGEAMSDEEFQKLLAGLDEKNDKVTEDLKKDFTETKATDTIDEKDALISALTQKLNSYITKNGKMAVELAEKKMYADDMPQEITIFNEHMGKAREGNEEAKRKIIDLIDSLRKELVGKSFTEEDIEKNNKAVSDSNGFNSHTDTKEIKAGEASSIKIL